MITSFNEFIKLKVGTLFTFDNYNNSLYYIESVEHGKATSVVYVQEFTGCLPRKAVTPSLWNQNSIKVDKVYTLEEMNKLEATLLTLTGLINE